MPPRMPVCEAWNCENSTDDCPGTTFHKFPLNSPVLLKAWVHNVNLPAPWEPSAGSVLCSDHFLERCFVRTNDTVRLRSDAVPTIFAYPDDRQQDVVEVVLDSSGQPVKTSEGSESSSLDHCYGTSMSTALANTTTVPRETAARKVRTPEDGDSIRKKLKLSRQRVRRLEERVSMLNDMVYSLLNQTIMEM